ncbi:MAG: tetratricopeptide repeat protein [Pseudomonadales bacterium]|nr:tetratricopeptide repeat protein [Pseudomonadales bacterium]
MNAGKALIKLSQYHEALNAFTRSENINPELASIYILKAFCYRQLGHFNKAQNAYEKALKIQPNYALTHYNYAILLDLYLQKPAQALQHFEDYQALQNKPDKQVKRWIKELNRRVIRESSNRP